MDLREIEATADNVAETLLVAGRGEAELLALHLQGLKALTSIKAIVAHQKRMENQTYPPMYVPGATPAYTLRADDPNAVLLPNGALIPKHVWEPGCCTISSEYQVHITEPTKPAVDRLHELVSYCRKHEREAPVGGGGGAYGDVGDQLDEILREGEL